jgi:hypothetical protein
MCTVIFENTRFKEENKVLAKIAPAKSPSAKVIDMQNFQQLCLSSDDNFGANPMISLIIKLLSQN